MAMEKKYSKDEILEKYLNIAYFGAGAYGVEAAAKRFFGVTAADLDPAAGGDAGRAPYRTPTATDPNAGQEEPGAAAGPAQRRARPDGRAEEDHAGARPPRPRPSQARLQGHQAARAGARPAITRSSASTSERDPQQPRASARRQGARGVPQQRRPDHQDHDRPDDAGGRGQGDQEVGLPHRQPGRRPRPWSSRAPERSRRMATSRKYGRSKAQERDLLQPRRRRGARRRPRFPGRLDVQGVHAAHRAGGGLEDQRRVHRRRRLSGARVTRRSRTARATTSATRPTPSPTTRARRLQDPADRHLGLGEHVLHDAGAAGRPLRRGQDRQVAGHQALRRPAAAGVRDLHARHQRDGPGDGGHRLRRHRRTGQVLRADGDHRDHRPRRQDHRLQAQVPPGASTPRSPTRRPTSCRACSPRAR